MTLSQGFAAAAILPAPVLVVEDEPLIQQRLLLILQQLGYASDELYFAASLAQARQCCEDQPFVLALVDLGLPDGRGTELIAELRATDPGMGILVISAYSTEDAIITALKAGATGYLLKERDDFEVSLSIRNVLRGGAPIDPFIARRLLAEFRKEDTPPAMASSEERLSERELEILTLVAGGLSNRKISERLYISRFTVDTHVKRIYRKLAVSSRVQAVSAARSRGLLD